MKKRTILALIITLSTVIFTNKYWLIYKPMSVDFDIIGNGMCAVKIQLNKKNNNRFDKVRSERTDINFDKDTHVHSEINSKYPKRIRFIFNGVVDHSPIEIKNIYLKNKKYKLDRLDCFSLDYGKLLVKKNALIIYPENNNFKLCYNRPLDIRTSIKFDFKMLVIIMFLTFLLSYKLSNYIADFNTIKNKSRIEIIFLTTFFIMLFIPMSHINNDEISEKENRTLSTWKTFIRNNEINYNFGKDFNNWFNDRFALRQPLISLYLRMKYSFVIDYAEVPTGYVYKKSGWMFYNETMKDYNHAFTPLTKNDINKCTQNIKILLDYCKKQHIKLYIIIVPTKECIYREMNYIHMGNAEEKTKNLVNNVSDTLSYDIIYPVEPFMKLKSNEYVYYKTDHHLTDSGQYLLYEILMERIKKDFNDICITDKKEFDVSYNNLTRWDWDRKYVIGSNYERAELHDKNLLKPKYKYYDYKNLKSIDITGEYPYFQHINKNGKYKMFIIGNSFSESLVYFLNTSFKEIEKYRWNSKISVPIRNAQLDIKGYIPAIEKQQPDILLLVLSTGYVEHLKELY